MFLVQNLINAVDGNARAQTLHDDGVVAVARRAPQRVGAQRCHSGARWFGSARVLSRLLAIRMLFGQRERPSD
jgi:hypothetical protein